MVDFNKKLDFHIDPAKHIVVLQIAGLGDFTMATPTIRAIREHYPENPIDLFVAERTLSLAEDFNKHCLPSPVDVLPFKTDGNFFPRNLSNLRIIKNVARKNPALLIELNAIESKQAAIRRKIFIKLFNSEITIGRDTDGRGGFFDFGLKEILFSKVHEVTRKIEVIKLIGITINNCKLYFYINEEAKIIVNDFIEKHNLRNRTIIGINTGAFSPNRGFAVDKYIEIIKNLRSETGAFFLIFGGENELEFINQICKSASSDYIYKVYNQSFSQVGAWLKACKLFITNDSGLMHFAAALKVPCIAIFGPENPYRYEPWGDFPKKIFKHYPKNNNTFSPDVIFEKNSIQYISSQTVTEAALAYIKKGSFN